MPEFEGFPFTPRLWSAGCSERKGDPYCRAVKNTPSTATADSPPTRSQPRLALQTRGLARQFGEVQALLPLDLELGLGEIVGLVGPNGSGKSTFLRLLVGLIRPSAGTAEVAGTPLRGDGIAVRKRCTFAPGELATYRELTGIEHLRFGLRGRPRSAFGRAVQICERLELPIERSVRGYSHGMKRQLLLATALAPDVPLRILDEPTEGLDPTKRKQVLDLLEEDRAPHRTILLSSHHLGEVDRACDRLLFLERGALVADESAAELRERSRRMLRLGYAHPEQAAAAAEFASAHGAELLGRREDSISVLIPSADPREFLRGLSGDPTLAPPIRLDFGAPSLEELYRDVFGVEGV